MFADVVMNVSNHHLAPLLDGLGDFADEGFILVAANGEPTMRGGQPLRLSHLLDARARGGQILVLTEEPFGCTFKSVLLPDAWKAIVLAVAVVKRGVVFYAQRVEPMGQLGDGTSVPMFRPIGDAIRLGI